MYLDCCGVLRIITVKAILDIHLHLAAALATLNAPVTQDASAARVKCEVPLCFLPGL